MTQTQPQPPRRTSRWATATSQRYPGSPVGLYATTRLATTHPAFYLGFAAVVAVAGSGAALLVPGLAPTSGGRLLLVALALVAALVIAGPGWWSARHRQDATGAVDARSRQDVQSLQRHPVLGFVVAPVLLAGVLAWRDDRYLEHLSRPHLVLVVAAAAVALGLLRWAGYVVERRRLQRAGATAATSSPSPSR